MRRLAAILMLGANLVAGGCASYSDDHLPSPPPPAPPVPRHPPMDSCGANAMQYLVGRPVAELPAQSRREERVVGTHASIDQRFDPDRVTILYDEDSGRIARVRCG